MFILLFGFVLLFGVCVINAVGCSLVILCWVSARVSCCTRFVYVLLLFSCMLLFSILSSYFIFSYLYCSVVP